MRSNAGCRANESSPFGVTIPVPTPLFMLLRRSLPLAFGFLLALAATASAQDPDIIRGRVTGPDSLPIENAIVTVTTIQGDMVKTDRTDKNGGFTVTFIDPQGDYWVSIQSLGYAPRRRSPLADRDDAADHARPGQSTHGRAN
jgi:hypothetical protein